MKKYYYQVAEHTFSVEMPEGETVIDEMGQYSPFVVDGADDVAFALRVVGDEEFPRIDDVQVEMHQDDDGSQILAGRANGLPYFEFQLWGKSAAKMVTDEAYQEATVLLVDEPLFGINNALMVMYALSAAPYDTLLFHASTVSVRGRAYLFLGKSGTGKSTHSQLWQKYVPDVQLINDDNPVVRMVGGLPYVYGSPWSGKTPCYRNVRMIIRSMVLLQQSPKNAIRRLATLEAYGAVIGSVSGMQWNRQVADALHRTEEKL